MQHQINNNNFVFYKQEPNQGFCISQMGISQQNLLSNISQFSFDNQIHPRQMIQTQNQDQNLLKLQHTFISNQKDQLQVKQEVNNSCPGRSWYIQEVNPIIQQKIQDLYCIPQQSCQQSDLQLQNKNFSKCNNFMQEQSSDYSNMKCSRQESSTKISNGASCSTTNNTIKPVTNVIKKKIGKSYQDTKNIPKNFGKAIMKYIKEQQEVAQKLLGSNKSFQQFYQRILSKKDKIISIKEFKTLFSDQVSQKEKNNFPHLSEETILLFNKVYRSLAYKFLRSEFQSYLLGNRKIKHIDVMNKYKIVLLQGIVSPNEFNSWKISE